MSYKDKYSACSTGFTVENDVSINNTLIIIKYVIIHIYYKLQSNFLLLKHLYDIYNFMVYN